MPKRAIDNRLIYHLSDYANIMNPIQYLYAFLYDEKWNMLNKNNCLNTKLLSKIQDIDFSKKSTSLKYGPNPYGIEHVTFTGGGAKGTIYAGTLLALLISGLIIYLNKFTGTSAGAMTTCICGCITPNKKVYDEIKLMYLDEISKKNDDLISRYYLCVAYVINKLYKTNMEDLMGKLNMVNFPSNIKNLLNTGALLNPATNFIPWYINMCETICIIMDNGLEKYITEETLFTFEEYTKTTGKSLVIVAADVNKQSSIYFSEKKSPNVNVIDAVKASMAIPLAFPGQKIGTSTIKVKDGILYDDENEPITYIDGGMYDNYALNNSDLQDHNGNIVGYDRKQLGFFLTTQKTPYEIYRTLLHLYVKINESIANVALAVGEGIIREKILKDSGIEKVRNTIKNFYFERKYLEDIKNKLTNLCDEIIEEVTKDPTKERLEMKSEIIKKRDDIFKKIDKLLKQKIYHPVLESTEERELKEREEREAREKKEIEERESKLELAKDTDIIKNNIELSKITEKEEENNKKENTNLQKIFGDEENYDVSDHIAYCFNNRYIDIELDIFHKDIKGFYDLINKCMNTIGCDKIKNHAEILDNIIKLRNPVYIIFKEFWRSVGYAEDANNFFFGYADKKERYHYYGTYVLAIKQLVKIIDEITESLLYIGKQIKLYEIQMFDFSLTTHQKINVFLNVTQMVTTTIYKMYYEKASLLSLIKTSNVENYSISDLLEGNYIKIASKVFSETTMDTLKSVLSQASTVASIPGQYLNMVNNKSAQSVYNKSRTVSFNVFDAGTLEFTMSHEKKSMLIYEGYQKTIKHLSQILCLQELTGVYATDGGIPGPYQDYMTI
jgi:predicted acylesterase/phospholipase RssA